jgi:hypothetical protein
MRHRPNSYKINSLEYVPHAPVDWECVMIWSMLLGMVMGFWLWVLFG